MSDKIESTTDTPEQVRQAIGGASSREVEEPAADPVDPAENEDDSEPSKEESEKPAREKFKAEDSEEDEEDEEEQKEAPKKTNGFKKRIDKLRSRINAAAQERDYWKEQALKAKQPQETKPEEPKKAVGKPRAEDFDKNEEFVEALADWKLEQREKAAKVADVEAKAKADFTGKVEKYQKACTELTDKIEDFEETLESSEVDISPTVRQLLLDHESGAELSYHLAKNPEDFARICKLPLAAAARELGKFEAKHLSAPESEAKPKEVKTTNAPAPIKPVKAKGTANTGEYREDMSLREYEKWVEKTFR